MKKRERERFAGCCWLHSTFTFLPFLVSVSSFVLCHPICHSESHQPSQKQTESHVLGARASVNFSAQPHVIKCMWARNCSDPQSQLRLSNKKVPCKGSIREFLARVNAATITPQVALVSPTLRTDVRNSGSHSETKKTEIKKKTKCHYTNDVACLIPLAFI